MNRLLLSIGLIFALAGCNRATHLPHLGSAAPDFVVQDSDRKVALSDLKGQIVILNFWATWCPPCVQEMPSLVQLQKTFKGKGVTVLAVSVDADESAYRKFLIDHGVDLLTVRDEAQKSNSLYGTMRFPETYIIDRRGIVRRKFIGAIDWNTPEIAEFLNKL